MGKLNGLPGGILSVGLSLGMAPAWADLPAVSPSVDAPEAENALEHVAGNSKIAVADLGLDLRVGRDRSKHPNTTAPPHPLDALTDKPLIAAKSATRTPAAVAPPETIPHQPHWSIGTKPTLQANSQTAADFSPPPASNLTQTNIQTIETPNSTPSRTNPWHSLTLSQRPDRSQPNSTGFSIYTLKPEKYEQSRLRSQSSEFSSLESSYFVTWPPNFSHTTFSELAIPPTGAAIAQSTPETESSAETEPPARAQSPGDAFDLSPEVIKDSPVLRRWLRKIPNVLSEIKRDPSFRTRLRLGYSFFPSTNDAGGLNLGLEDVFIGRTGLTLNGEYHTSFDGRRELLGGDLRYYVRPLGSYVNVAAVAGYRHLDSTRFSTDGVNLGARLLLSLSRTGAADFSISQTWVSPGGSEEVGLTTVSFGYAVTRHLRLATDLQKQNSRYRKDSRVGIVLEWMF